MLTLPCRTLAKGPVESLDAAYQILVAFAQDHHPALNDDHPGKYYCDYCPKQTPFYIVGLHRSDETKDKDWVGSDLAGWYGVDERDGAIVEWNMAEDIPGKSILAGTKTEPNKALVPTVMSVTPAADAPVAPATTAAHL